MTVRTGNIVLFALVFFSFASMLHGADCSAATMGSSGLAKVCTTVKEVCTQIRQLIPAVALLMVFSSAVIYTGGQWTGAETRARANVWSTNMLVGAIMGLLISTIGPFVISQLWPTGGTIDC